MDPEEVKSLDSNGAGEKSENNSSNSDIVHVEKEEIPEGMEEAAAGLQAAFPETPEPLLPHSTATTLLQTAEAHPGMAAAEKTSPATSLFVEFDEEEVRAATTEPGQLGAGAEVELGPALEPTPTPLSALESRIRKEALTEELSGAADEKAMSLSEGKSILLFGGAAAMAILAVAVGVTLALRKK
ncbi:bcl-2-like protein 13 isoform X5 [Echinops telfairi]|nr:bcl-2-like protein 13 isoform X5 [Echinops telfairi]